MNDRRRKSEPSGRSKDEPQSASAAKRRCQALDAPSVAEKNVVEAKITGEEEEEEESGKVPTVNLTTDSKPVPRKRCSITMRRRSSIGLLRMVHFDSTSFVAGIESKCQKDVPADERLRDVMRRCAELVFKELDAKLDKSNESTFLAGMETTLDQLMAKGIFKLATTRKTTVLPGLDQKSIQEWDEVVKETEACVDRLAFENKRWDEIFRDHEKPRSQKKRRLNAKSDAITATPGADCECLVGRVNVSMEILGVQVAILSEAAETLCHFNARADEHLTIRVNALSGGESSDGKQLLKAVINGSI